MTTKNRTATTKTTNGTHQAVTPTTQREPATWDQVCDRAIELMAIVSQADAQGGATSRREREPVVLPRFFLEEQADLASEVLHEWMIHAAPPEIAELWHAYQTFTVAQEYPDASDEHDKICAVANIAAGRQFVDGCKREWRE